MSSCRVCGRQIELSDSGQFVTCRCINDSLSQFPRYAVSTCVDPERESRGEERDDEEPPDA